MSEVTFSPENTPTGRQEHAALARYHEARARGLSDYEAREDGWPVGLTERVQRQLADEWHRDQCGCDTWPAACVTYPPFNGSSLGHAPMTWPVEDVLVAAGLVELVPVPAAGGDRD